MSKEWNIEEDLWLQSEIPKIHRVPPKPSIYLARGRSSLFDHSDEEQEEDKAEEPQVKYVRGRPIYKNSRKDSKPGGKPSMLSDQETVRQIREVSGLGYSNELIERSIKRSQHIQNTTPPPIFQQDIPDFSFKSTSTPSTTTGGSTSSSSYKSVKSTTVFNDWVPKSINIECKNDFPSLK